METIRVPATTWPHPIPLAHCINDVLVKCCCTISGQCKTIELIANLVIVILKICAHGRLTKNEEKQQPSIQKYITISFRLLQLRMTTPAHRTSILRSQYAVPKLIFYYRRLFQQGLVDPKPICSARLQQVENTNMTCTCFSTSKMGNIIHAYMIYRKKKKKCIHHVWLI